MQSDRQKNQKIQTSITVFFPCYNEQDNITPTVKNAIDVLEKINADYEIIIVNDGSTDNTPNVAESLAADSEKVKLVNHEKNLGYGAALQTGFKAATKPLVFYTDGDGQFDISEMPSLLYLIPQYDIVSCYRVKRKDPFIRKLNAWAWTRLGCFLFKLKIRDIDCAFKLYKREIFDNIKMTSSGALIDTEILARAKRKGYTITQRPVKHYPRKAGRQTGANLKVIIKAFKELFALYRKIKNEN